MLDEPRYDEEPCEEPAPGRDVLPREPLEMVDYDYMESRRQQRKRAATKLVCGVLCSPCLLVWWVYSKVMAQKKVDNVLADTENAFQVCVCVCVCVCVYVCVCGGVCVCGCGCACVCF
jgi:hypothetical protein